MRRADRIKPGESLIAVRLASSLRSSLKAALVSVSVLSLVAAPHAALAADPAYLSADYGASGDSSISLGIGKSYVVSLPRDAKEVFVADPAIANAVVRSARKAYLIGAAPGQTDVKFIDSEGREIASYEVSVSRDVGSIRSSIGRSINGGNVRVEGVGDGVVVTGSVKSAQEAQTAIDIAGGYMADPKKVVNALRIEGQDQVMLKVKIVEMQREVLKQLGVDYAANGLDVLGTKVIGATLFPFSATGTTPSDIVRPILQGETGTVANPVIGAVNSKGTFGAQIQALERNGVARTLAEPTLTAISGENAKFLVGGEFPIITGVDADTRTATVSFKQFGVGLNFTPVVLSGGRISLRLSTEVSEIDNNSSVTLSGTTIPGLKTRRADSTVEIPSGGSLVMAGLIQQQTKRAVNGLPGLMNLPVLGQLFRSNDYQRNETELAIFVTPYIAKAVAPQKLASPDDGFAEPSDPSNLLFGRLNRIYGLPEGRAERTIVSKSQGGFILD
ncbi:type II and III secretion system protein family protein [Hansschlegelia quercus]|uniref:Type II and III secretion system protein family protein n=1 Tax=Hansschlegelia quercus TaxID=2528245 RepID=A0A4Q9GBB8_9HYPH|nr:type II and III secretion system protein family protein [Hansschlegelia quercus]TBN48327.1 type II and III secretion system protein family protein [Hansschlegelia quercus]